MADNISEPPKSNEQAIYLKSANISLTEYRVEETTETVCILWPVPAFGWAPLIIIISKSLKGVVWSNYSAQSLNKMASCPW